MKMQIVIFGISWLLLGTVISQEKAIRKVLNYNGNPDVRYALDSYSIESVNKTISLENDAMTKFLILLDAVLTVDKAIEKCKGSHFVNVGMTGRNGDLYSSGISPEGIEDEEDRKNYKNAISVNTANYKTIDLLRNNRDKIFELLQSDMANINEKQRQIAVQILERLRK